MNLAQLIATHRGDRSNLELAALCSNRPSPQRWGEYANGKEMRNFPDPETIRAIAKVLRVTERQVVLAASESLNLDTSEFASPERNTPQGAAKRESDTASGTRLTAVPHAVAPEDEERGSVRRLPTSPPNLEKVAAREHQGAPPTEDDHSQGEPGDGA